MVTRLRRLPRAGLVVLALFLVGCSDARGAGPQAVSAEVQALIDDARVLREQPDEAAARALLRESADPTLLARLSLDDALLADHIAADVADALDDQPALIAAQTRAAASPVARQADFTALLQSQIANFDMTGADDTMRALRDRWPKDALGGLTPNQIMKLERGLGDLTDRPGAQLDFERYLDWAGWYGPRDWFTSDGAMLRQAVQEWELGDRATAERLLNRLTLPVAIAAVRADRRFDAVVAANPRQFDVDRASQREVSRLRRALWLECCKPRLGAPSAALSLSEALYIAGDDAGALAAAERARGKDQDQGGFEDSAIAMSRLALRRGAVDTAERHLQDFFYVRPTPALAQAMAELMVATGRGGSALAVLAPITEHNLNRINMDQRIKVLSLEVCAAVQTGDQLKPLSALAYIDAHASAGLSDAIDAHLCTGDVQGAATLVVRMLEDPRRRHSALLDLQDWRQPVYRTAWRRQMDDRRQALRARPEVEDIVRRVGRINAYDLRYTRGVQ